MSALPCQSNPSGFIERPLGDMALLPALIGELDRSIPVLTLILILALIRISI